MDQSTINTSNGSSVFLQKHSLMIRIWHWLTFLLIASAMVTILINSTITNPGKRTPMVQEQLKLKNVEVTEEQAFAVSHQYEEVVWGVHKWIGYGLALLLISRILIEFLQPAEEKFRFRFRNALGVYKSSDKDKSLYLHYLGIKMSYIFFYALLIIMVITGLGLAFGRDLGFTRELRVIIREVHNIGQLLMYLYVTVHLAGVVFTDIKKANGLISGMINGNKN